MMIKVVIAASMLLATGVASASAREGYLGEGVQGRPHGKSAAVRAYYFRHGLGYERFPRHMSHRYYHHYYRAH